MQSILGNNLLTKFLILFFLLFSFCGVVYAVDITDSAVVIISARVNDANENPSQGGGPIAPVFMQTTVNFSGTAYPFSNVYLLKDGQIVSVVLANVDGSFSISIKNLNTNVYTFSIYAEDNNQKKSSFYSFPLYLTSGITVNIRNILLSPTINLDKIKVKLGENVTIFGKSAPKAEVNISVLGIKESFYKIISNHNGDYSYNLNTSLIGIGKYQTKSNQFYKNQFSSFTSPLVFVVSDQNKNTEDKFCSSIRGDLNCDGHVDLKDFSIMAFWYKKINPPQKIDLSGDGVVNLIDFSILAFNWTG